MVEKTNAVDVSGTSEFNSTARFRVKNNSMRKTRPSLQNILFSVENVRSKKKCRSEGITAFMFREGFKSKFIISGAREKL